KPPTGIRSHRDRLNFVEHEPNPCVLTRALSPATRPRMSKIARPMPSVGKIYKALTALRISWSTRNCSFIRQYRLIKK
ncbi:MAG: hypothetical protein WA743_05540, partial [Pseudolabrys sp.]